MSVRPAPGGRNHDPRRESAHAGCRRLARQQARPVGGHAEVRRRDWLPSRKLDAKLHELDMRNIEREERRNKAKRGPIGKQGERGARGERGPIGPASSPAGKPVAAPARIVGWRHNPERYETTPLMSDGTEDNDLRPFHVQYQRETT